MPTLCNLKLIKNSLQTFDRWFEFVSVFTLHATIFQSYMWRHRCTGGLNWVELNLLFNVTINDISVIYVTAHRCAGGLKKTEEEVCTYRRVPNAIDISQGSLTCPSYTDTEQPFLYGDSDTPPHLIAFYDTLGIRRTYSLINPPPPPASSRGQTFDCN